MSCTLNTERLILRPLALTDAEPTSALMTPGIGRWTGSWTGSDTPGQVAERIGRLLTREREGLSFDRAMVVKADGALIGWIGVRRSDDEPRRASLGYWIGEAWFGRGYTREAARAIVDAAWTALDLDVIEATAQVQNAASLAILRGLGMRHMGRREEFSTARGASDLCDWFELKRPQAPG